MKASLILIVMLAFLPLVSGCSPALQTSPAPLSSATLDPLQATSQPIAPLSSPTPTLETPVVVPTFQLSSACVLTPAQRSRLETVSRKFLASTDEQALQVARDLDYIGINGQPATMCGPLSVAILQDAGLVDPYYDRANFYLLNPRPGFGDAYVESLFPSSRYLKIVEERVIKEVDYQTDPLCPGDFLYLFAGESGSYEHMLVVTRVDEFGRAYTVTNIDFREGYRVEELMLYDPAQPGVGMFTDWTSSPHPQIGRTGYDGFWLWRLKAPIADPSPAAVELAAAIDSIIEQTGGIWHVQFKEVGGDVLYSRLADTRIHPASVIKLADAVLFLNLLENTDVSDLPVYLRDHGTSSRSFEQLLRAMVVNSEESATTSIENWISGHSNPNIMIQELGFENTFIIPRQSTTAELAGMIEQLYLGSLLGEESTAYLLGLLAEYTPSDVARTGVIRTMLGEGDLMYNKRGSLADFRVIVADLALVRFNGKAYTLAFFAYPDVENNGKPTYESLEKGVEQIAGTIMDFLKDQ